MSLCFPGLYPWSCSGRIQRAHTASYQSISVVMAFENIDLAKSWGFFSLFTEIRVLVLQLSCFGFVFFSFNSSLSFKTIKENKYSIVLTTGKKSADKKKLIFQLTFPRFSLTQASPSSFPPPLPPTMETTSYDLNSL